jgi:hypothetical protein
MVVLFEACGGRGNGASGLTGGLSGSRSQLSDVEQKMESEKSGILTPMVADPDPSASERVRGRESAVRAGEFNGAAARLGLGAKGGRTLLPFCTLCSLVTTGIGRGDCIAGKGKSLRSRVRDCVEEMGAETGGRGTSGVMNGRLACFLTGEFDWIEYLGRGHDGRD